MYPQELLCRMIRSPISSFDRCTLNTIFNNLECIWQIRFDGTLQRCLGGGVKITFFSLFLTQISFAIQITNKAGNKFEADILDVVIKENGADFIKVRRTFDNVDFEIPLLNLHEKNLIEIIKFQESKNKGNKAQPRPQIARVPIANLQNSDWKKFKGKLISDFRTDPRRWNRKNVIIYAHFDYKSSFNEQISVEQGDNSIWVNYSKLSRREKSVILQEESFSERLVKVDGEIVMQDFSDNMVKLIADKIEFVE